MSEPASAGGSGEWWYGVQCWRCHAFVAVRRNPRGETESLPDRATVAASGIRCICGADGTRSTSTVELREVPRAADETLDLE